MTAAETVLARGSVVKTEVALGTVPDGTALGLVTGAEEMATVTERRGAKAARETDGTAHVPGTGVDETATVTATVTATATATATETDEARKRAAAPQAVNKSCVINFSSVKNGRRNRKRNHQAVMGMAATASDNAHPPVALKRRPPPTLPSLPRPPNRNSNHHFSHHFNPSLQLRMRRLLRAPLHRPVPKRQLPLLPTRGWRGTCTC